MVEDEDSVRKLGRMILEARGYEVSTPATDAKVWRCAKSTQAPSICW